MTSARNPKYFIWTSRNLLFSFPDMAAQTKIPGTDNKNLTSVWAKEVENAATKKIIKENNVLSATFPTLF